MKLGKREVDGLSCPPGRRDILVFDDDLPGFGLRVTEAGTKTFLLQYQTGGRAGRRVRMILGNYGELTPAAARRQAEAARGLLRQGRDPKAERAAALAEVGRADSERKQKALTLAELVDRWEEVGLADRSAGHRAEAPRAVRSCFAGELDNPAQGLTVETVQQILDAIARQKPVMARRVRDYGRSMFNWAARRRLVTGNPFADAAVEGREMSRDRVLTDAELGEAWRAAGTLPGNAGAFIRLLVLTLQRRVEVAGMRWREISADLSTWTIPAERAKNRKEHIVHLAEPAREILRHLPRSNDDDLLFPASRSRPRQLTGDGRHKPEGDLGAGKKRPISGFSDLKERLLAAIEREREKSSAKLGGAARPPQSLDWRLHDLRRTGVTALARLGIAPHVADRLLNHVQGSAIRGVAAVYQRHEFMAERKAALQTWANHVLAVAANRGRARRRAGRT